MAKIKNIVFDLGGVIIDLDRDQAVKRFKAIGVEDADQIIDTYEQKGIFREVEEGKITAEQFCQKLRDHSGKELSFDDVTNAWLGFVVGVAQYKLDFIDQLRKDYKLYMLSNTNPFIQCEWALTDRFTEAGRPVNDYFDKLYFSYEVGITKPDRGIFDFMIADSGMLPAETLFVDDGKSNIVIGEELGFITYMPANKEDWREPLRKILAEDR